MSYSGSANLAELAEKGAFRRHDLNRAGGLTFSCLNRLQIFRRPMRAPRSKRLYVAMVWLADSDEAGQAFQFEAGRGSDLKSATWRRPRGSRG
jgi:hypothetical protein